MHVQSTPALGQRHRRTKRLPIFGPVFAQTHRQAQHKTPPPQLVKFHLMRSGRPGPGDCRICRIDWAVLPMKHLPPPPGLLRAPPPLTTDPTHVVVLFFRESFVMNKAHHCTAPAQEPCFWPFPRSVQEGDWLTKKVVLKKWVLQNPAKYFRVILLILLNFSTSLSEKFCALVFDCQLIVIVFPQSTLSCLGCLFDEVQNWV